MNRIQKLKTSEIEIKKKKRERGGAWRSVQELPENPIGK
jgi:hypothetical protein